MRRQIFSFAVLLILFLTAGAQSGRADSYTESFNGYTFNSQVTGALFGHLTLNTDLLPPLDVPGPNPFPSPYSSWSLTWIKTDGAVINMDTLVVDDIWLGPYGYNPSSPSTISTGCSLVSGQGNSPAGQPYSACGQILSFGYKGNPDYVEMTIQGGFFDQRGLWVNYDDTDGPGRSGDILRGTWTLVPEPPSWMMALSAALVMCFLKFKS